MKIGLIGFGYWGKIIYNNLKKIDCEVIVCDNESELEIVEYKNYRDLINKNIDYVFVITPTVFHFDCVKFFLEKGINVFCEKPLSLSSLECSELFKLSEENNCILHIDWIYTFNDHVDYIKNIINSNVLGKLQSITMKRLNRGPIRYDVSAKWDLMSHDLSILFYILEKNPSKVKFIEFFKKINNLKFDSCISLINFEDVHCTLECSWEYPIKDRKCVFEFEEGHILWDDNEKKLIINEEIIDIPEQNTPLEKSIKTFLSKKTNSEFHKNITLKVTKILEKNDKI